MQHRYVSIGAMTLVMTGASSAAPIMWSGNGHSYEVVVASGPVTWYDARTQAQALGGDLATITSQAESDFVFSIVDNAAYWRGLSVDFIGPWLGGFQPAGSPEPSGGWSWVTGEAFSFSAWNPVTNEPNNSGGNEDGVFYYNAFSGERVPLWNDFSRSHPLPTSFVVEYVPEPAAGVLALAGLMLMQRRRRAA